MFGPNSRYFDLPTTTLTVVAPDGTRREVRYVRRRFVPATDPGLTVAEHTVTQGERLDNVIARYLGDPTLFWQVCDVNGALWPEDLEEMGRVVKIVLIGG